MIKTAFASIVLLIPTIAVAQETDNRPPAGTIYGIAIAHDGQPAKGIRLTAFPLGVGLSAVLPKTRTNNKGEYRFETLPWWGRYTVYADDEDAGYSMFGTGPADDAHPPEVEITPEHREAEFKVYLPPKSGFVHVHLTNARTGAAIPGMQVAVMAIEDPKSPLFTNSCGSTQVILVPPDKNLLLHVTSDGFREWSESVGSGKPLHLSSGAKLTLDVQLEPSD